jgi:plasmid stability protein
MAQVIIRNLDPETVEALKARAKRNGRSLEAELREVLARSVACDAREEFLEWVDRHRLPAVTGLDIVELIREGREVRTRAILEAALGTDH